MNDNDDRIAMEGQCQPLKNPESLQTLTSGHLSSSLSSLSSSSLTLPSNQDFHFFNNFDDFKLPVDQIAKTSDSLLESIGSSAKIWGHNKAIIFPNNIESIAHVEAYDWLANTNDEILERVDVSMDEYQKSRKKEEETIGSDPDNSGFQLVYGKKKKKVNGGLMSDSVGDSVSGKEGGSSSSSTGVKVKKGALAAGTTGKAKVPFHIPTIRKPQEEYRILVNNSNQPFEHVWLQRSEDGQRFVHPLVDLEHNQYRSFQGLTCLMQISTRTEDFIVDTLKLRIHVGPYLREAFKDPTKKKVMHGADRDIVWLQRDFGIYLCNLFDTGQASKVLKLERKSLEYLLHHFCGVTANKEYQNADWRLRPLPDEMLRYAREDTHYLLYIYDLMRIKLLSMPKESEHCDAPLIEVYKRSSDVCMQLYEKELLTENSYLHIYGLQGIGFNAEQLAIVAGLCEWRDIIGRAEDESTGYVLPNKTLLEIAKQMPVTASKLRRLLKSKHPYVEQNLGAVVSIIRHSMPNAVAFEAAAQQLRMGNVQNASEEHVAVAEGAKVLSCETPTDLKIANDRTEIIDDGMGGPDRITAQPASPRHKQESIKIGSNIAGLDTDRQQKRFPFKPDVNGISMSGSESLAISEQSGEVNACTVSPSAKIATGATVQVLKKPSCGFGALLGNAATKKKFDIDKKGKEESKLEQNRSSVNLSFHSFLGTELESKPEMTEPTRVLEEVSQPEEPPAVVATESTFENIIMLEDNSNKYESFDARGSSEIIDIPSEESSMAPFSETNEEDETMSLSDLSTSFQRCFQAINQNRKAVKVKKSKEPSGLMGTKPFDYEAARKEVGFGDVVEEESGSLAKSSGKNKSSASGRLQIYDGGNQFPRGRRRQTFPSSGNRTATFSNDKS
ncbi:protein RRP6-like 2 isoform X2 [Durio zibethinus]|uniref:Protein RRP6-like 2 isoform X2 n=1 Tax=Durio zibethinus TaxID=66656 RepID=A0A6P5Z2A6_DURZI|nr:protein RRP6-like 2 isoform X2 [Durio zibethinus]